MALASAHVFLVKSTPKVAAVSVVRVSLRYLLPPWEALQDQLLTQVPFILLLLLWISTCEILCVPFKSRVCVSHSLPGSPESKPCCSMGSSSQGRTPGLRSSVWGSTLLLLEKHACNCSCPLMFYLYKADYFDLQFRSVFTSCLAVVNCCLCSLFIWRMALFSIHTTFFFLYRSTKKKKYFWNEFNFYFPS